MFILRHHENDFTEDLAGGCSLFTPAPQMAEVPLGNLLKAQKSASRVPQSKQSSLHSLPPRDPAQRKLQHTYWAVNLHRTIGLMKMKKLSLKIRLSQLNIMILSRCFVNKCSVRVARKDLEVLMQLNKSWMPHIGAHPSFHSSGHESVWIACMPYFCFAMIVFMYIDMLIHYFKCLCLCKQNVQLIKCG